MKTMRDPLAILRADYATVRRHRAEVEGWPDELLEAEDARLARAIDSNDRHALELRSITFAVLAEPIRRDLSMRGAA